MYFAQAFPGERDWSCWSARKTLSPLPCATSQAVVAGPNCVSGWGSAQLLKRTGPGPCPISAGAFCAGQSWADCITNTVGSDFRQAQALNTVEFRLRENNTGAFPRGIVFMLRALGSWLHGRGLEGRTNGVHLAAC